MGRLLPALVVAVLPACATAEPGAPAPAVPEAACGDHRLRLARVEWAAPATPGAAPALALQLDLLPGAEGALLSCRPGRVRVATASGATAETAPAHFRGLGADGTVVVRGIAVPGLANAAVDVALEFTLLRVAGWTTRERGGLMDAGLDEEIWPPFRVSFAGEGETAWLGASMAERDAGFPPSAAALGEHLSFEFVTERATLRDAKGRVLSHYVTSGTGGAATASYAVGMPGGAPDADPSIAYPVTVRLDIPERWEAEVVRFVFRGLTLPSTKGNW